jgi:hypothetical protein
MTRHLMFNFLYYDEFLNKIFDLYSYIKKNSKLLGF